MTAEDRRDWIERLKARRDQEIQQMFAEYSDSNYIDYTEFSELRTYKIDFDICLLLELLTKKLDRERKKNTAHG